MSKEHTHLSWSTHGREKLQDCRIFSVYTVEREASDGSRGVFIEIDAPDWVTVIPEVTDEQGVDCFLMVNQYRHGTDSITREFPAGTVEPDEPKQEAALRELLEETGYRADELIELGEVSPNPAFMNNRVTTFLARKLTKVQGQQLDEHELIDVSPQIVSEVVQQMGSGMYDNGIMMISLLHYLRWKKAVSL